MNLSQIMAIVFALGSALAGVSTIVEQLNPKAGVVIMLASTLIILFCESLKKQKVIKDLED